MARLGVIRRPWQLLGPWPPWVIAGQGTWRGGGFKSASIQTVKAREEERGGGGTQEGRGVKKGKGNAAAVVQVWRGGVVVTDDGARRHLGWIGSFYGDNCCRGVRYIELKMNSMSLGFPGCLPLPSIPPSPLSSQSLSLQSSWRFILPALLASLFSAAASLSYLASPSPRSLHWLAWTNF